MPSPDRIRRVLVIFLALGVFVTLVSLKASIANWHRYSNAYTNCLLGLNVSSAPVLLASHGRGYLSTNYDCGVRSGLGNQIFELLAVIGIADKLNRIPYINVADEYMLKKLGGSIREQFPLLQKQFSIVYWNITNKVIPFNNHACCVYEDVERLRNETSEYLQLDGIYFQSYKYFDHRRSDVRNLLLPSEAIQEQARKNFPSRLLDHFLICVHIRRGDFVSIEWKSASEADFSSHALKFLMRKYSRKNKLVGAVILGNEAEWEKQTFEDIPRVHIMENSTPIEDFAFSRLYCDVVLITAPSSTFGFFLGYLSKRFDVYYRDIATTNDGTQFVMKQADFYPRSWTKIVEKDGHIKEVFDIKN